MAEDLLNGVLNAPRPVNTPSPEIAGNLTSAGLIDTALFRDVKMNRQGDNVGIEPSDWVNFDPARFVYASATTLTVFGIDATLYFQKGDKIWITQAGNTKFFYVIGVASALLTISAGTSYTLTNDILGYFAVSDKPSPSGFPSSFTYSPTLTALGTLTVSDAGNVQGGFSISGGIVYMSLSRTSAVFGGSGSDSVTESLPVPAGVMTSQLVFPVYTIGVPYTEGFHDWRIGDDTPTVITSPLDIVPGSFTWLFSIWYLMG